MGRLVLECRDIRLVLDERLGRLTLLCSSPFVGHRNAASHSVKQELLFVGAEDGKLLAMRQLLRQVRFYCTQTLPRLYSGGCMHCTVRQLSC